MKTKTKLLIMGYGRHGKDEMVNTLEKHFDFKAESSSMAAARIFIYELLKDKYGYESFEECYQDRRNHRPEWFDLITEYNRDDPSRLAREILKDNDCYVGMRNRTEVRTCVEEDVFDLIVWVDAGERVPPESSDSCEVSKEDAHIILTNNGTLEEFREKVMRLGVLLYPPKEVEEEIQESMYLMSKRVGKIVGNMRPANLFVTFELEQIMLVQVTEDGFLDGGTFKTVEAAKEADTFLKNRPVVHYDFVKKLMRTEEYSEHFPAFELKFENFYSC